MVVTLRGRKTTPPLRSFDARRRTTLPAALSRGRTPRDSQTRVGVDGVEVSRVATPEWSKQRTCCLAVRQRLNGPGEEVTRRSLTQRAAGITERRLAVQEQLAYRTVCMLQRHNVSSGVSRAEEAATVNAAEDGHCFNFDWFLSSAVVAFNVMAVRRTALHLQGVIAVFGTLGRLC